MLSTNPRWIPLIPREERFFRDLRAASRGDEGKTNRGTVRAGMPFASLTTLYKGRLLIVQLVRRRNTLYTDSGEPAVRNAKLQISGKGLLFSILHNCEFRRRTRSNQ